MQKELPAARLIRGSALAAMTLVALALTGVWAQGAGAAPATAPAAGPANLVLSNASMWRCYFVARWPVVRVGQEIRQVTHNAYASVWVVPEVGKELPPWSNSAAPPANWPAVDFDDGAWTRLAGPFFPSQGWAYTKQVDDAGFCNYEGTNPNLAAICLRGRFTVTDPATAGDLKLSVAYRGGVVVYLNGQEIARASIPDAEKARGIEALAEDYPKEVFVKEDGKVISPMFGEPPKYVAQLQQRVRKLDNVTVPGKLLRQGVNVLAIEAHRAPHHEATFGRTERGRGYLLEWCTVGVPRVELSGGGAGVRPTIARPAGVQVWAQDAQTPVRAADYWDPAEPPRPMRLVAARNGMFSGQVMVGSPAAMRGLKVTAGDLTGPGTIPAANVQVRFATADKDLKLPFDVLSPTAPAEVPADKAAGGAVASVWGTVKVPADAKGGDYKGKLAISVEGAAPLDVPVELRVVDWRLPDPKEFASHVGLTQSPESVAMFYKVPMWSPEHWKLLDRTFELMAQAGADDVFITAIRRTHHGNEHSMIRWIKQPDGAFKHDFSIAEKYLDLAVKHLGKVPVVCIYCWEPFTGSVYGSTVSKEARGMPFTILDPASGKLSEGDGPKWGTPEIREFWKPVFEGLREMLRKRGLENSLMVGVAGDSRPNKDAVEDIKAVAGEAKWVVQSHARADQFHGQPVGYLADVWNSPLAPDPAEKRLFGWQSPGLRVSFPRVGSATLLLTHSPLLQYRYASEQTSVAGIHGYGRVGADFWEVLDPKAPFRNGYSRSLNIAGRFLESNWGQLYVGNSTPYVLAPGPDGALATARFEMLRCGAQDLEARAFLEKALLDPALKAKLGDDLAQRCQQLLDERVRAILLDRTSWLCAGNAQARLAKLYALAAEAAGKLGG
jgi:hypothetical protein